MSDQKDKFSIEEISFFNKIDMFSSLFKSGAKAAEALGISEGTFNSYKYRLRHPKLANVAKLSSQIDEYLNQENHNIITKTSKKDSKIVIESSCISVPVFGEVGAGMALELWEQEPIEFITIMPEYNKPELRVFRVAGDSMQPTIKKGAYVGVTPLNDIMLKEGQIYLCYCPPFGCVVKRIKPAPNNTIVLLSDNPTYDPIPVSLDEYQKVVVGEVCWVMQMV